MGNLCTVSCNSAKCQYCMGGGKEGIWGDWGRGVLGGGDGAGFLGGEWVVGGGGGRSGVSPSGPEFVPMD